MGRPSPQGWVVIWLGGLFAFSACSGSERAHRTEVAPGAVISVAGEPIASESIVAVSVARGIPASEAAGALLTDAILARAFRVAQPDYAAYLRRTGLARRLSEKLMRRAKEQGPPTSAEVEALTERYWWQLDRPVASRTIHAVVLSENADEAGAAKALAERIRVRVANAGTVERFRELAEQLAAQAAEQMNADGLTVRVEQLLAVTPDGRAVDPARPPAPGSSTQRYALEVAAAANVLEHVGEVSPVVQSKFGYHVLMLSERIPSRRVPLDVRREKLAPEVYDQRARGLQETVLQRWRSELRIEIDRAALAQTEGLGVGQ